MPSPWCHSSLLWGNTVPLGVPASSSESCPHQASHVLPRASPRPWKAGAAASQACLPTLTEPTAVGQSESGASHHDRDLSGHLLLR